MSVGVVCVLCCSECMGIIPISLDVNPLSLSQPHWVQHAPA